MWMGFPSLHPRKREREQEFIVSRQMDDLDGITIPTPNVQHANITIGFAPVKSSSQFLLPFNQVKFSNILLLFLPMCKLFK